MKKTVCTVSALVLCFCLCACAKNEAPTMYIKPCEFSKETTEILDLFDDELRFFDLSLDETVKSTAITVWIYQNGEWVDYGGTYGNADYQTARIGIQLNESEYELYSIDEDGHTKYTLPFGEDIFAGSLCVSSTPLSQQTPIELNKEIPVWVKIGTNNSAVRVTDTGEDFRTADCSAGVAITFPARDSAVE